MRQFLADVFAESVDGSQRRPAKPEWSERVRGLPSEQGGELLKFMGDGLLAVFPIPVQDGDQGEVCSRVLAAGRAARARVAALEYAVADTAERFRFGLALHVGRLLYGNIGGGNRLDFTCIGPAVNLAARLEKIAARLGRTVIASEAFVGACAVGDEAGSDDPWTDLGEFPIAGFSTSQRVFGLCDEGD
jgi:adenylate cyclase